MGNVRIQLNDNASSINDFIHPDSHFIKKIIRESYTLSKCYHLESPVNVNKILDILGQHAYQLNENLAADLLDIEFLEEIAWHISERFINHIDLSQEKKRHNKTTAHIISFPAAKIRKANSRL